VCALGGFQDTKLKCWELVWVYTAITMSQFCHLMLSFADGNANFGDVEIHAISSLLKLFLVIYYLVEGIHAPLIISHWCG
jgi:hypothetical protein